MGILNLLFASNSLKGFHETVLFVIDVASTHLVVFFATKDCNLTVTVIKNLRNISVSTNVYFI